MEQLLNQLPEHNLRHIGWRAIALIVITLVVVVSFLIYAGGFEVLSRIFGSKAGTENTYVLAGLPNLEGNSDADSWIVQSGTESTDSGITSWLAAIFAGTGAFTSFTNQPDFMVSNATQTGFVMPLVTSMEPGQDTFPNHRYTSPAINLGTTGVAINNISIYAYLPETSAVTFGYRTADALDESDNSELHEFSEPVFTNLPENEDIKLTTLTLNRAVKQYLRMEVSFNEFVPTDRPTVYGWVITYGQDISVSSEEPILSTSEDAALTLTFSGGPVIPTDATVKLLCTDLALNPIYNKDKIDLSASNGEYIIPFKLRAGTYTIVITSPTTREIIVPFEATGEDTQTVSLGAFEGGQSNTSGSLGDLNSDGVINSADIHLLLEQYGEGDLTES